MTVRSAFLASVLTAGLLLAGCGDDDDTMAGDMPMDDMPMDDMPGDAHDEGNSPVAEGARSIEVTAKNFAFDPEEITAEAGEELTIVLSSEDALHDFTIDELDAHVVAKRNETAEGGVTADEAGSYTFYCSVPGHRSAGMEGTLTVE